LIIRVIQSRQPLACLACFEAIWHISINELVFLVHLDPAALIAAGYYTCIESLSAKWSDADCREPWIFIRNKLQCAFQRNS